MAVGFFAFYFFCYFRDLYIYINALLSPVGSASSDQLYAGRSDQPGTGTAFRVIGISDQCSGSVGFVRFWASGIRIRKCLYGSGYFYQQEKKGKILISTVLLLFNDLLPLKLR